MENVDPECVLPLVIIGAGPHALTLILSLLECTPQNTYSPNERDLEQHWRLKLKNINTECQRDDEKLIETIFNQVEIVDPSGNWMSRWNGQFEAYGIPHLRSPLIVHPDPLVDEGMRAFAFQHNRLSKETKETKLFSDQNTRSRRRGKYKGKRNLMTQGTAMFAENDRQRFALPSRSLFRDFCQDLIQRYKLNQKRIIPQKVVEIQPVLMDTNETYFRVILNNQQQLLTRSVVSAIGACNLPRIPASLKSSMSLRNVQHSIDLAQEVDEGGVGILQERFEHKRIAIVGGGLTSIHLCTQALRHGAKHVTLITRRQLQTQQYDVSVSWLSPTFRNVELAKFYSKTTKGRFQMLKNARNGGTITNEALQCLKNVATESNFTHLPLTTVSKIESTSSCLNVSLCSDQNDETLIDISIDHLLLATGMNMDARSEPMFQPLLKTPEAPTTYEGLPMVDKELRWKKDWNLFVIGGYAALELGPMALNLAGAKAGAARLRSILLEILRPERQQQKSHREYLNVLCRKSNIFAHLEDDI